MICFGPHTVVTHPLIILLCFNPYRHTIISHCSEKPKVFFIQTTSTCQCHRPSCPLADAHQHPSHNQHSALEHHHSSLQKTENELPPIHINHLAIADDHQHINFLLKHKKFKKLCCYEGNIFHPNLRMK